MIYLDNNATTPLDPRVREVMLPYLGSYFGNPSSPHSAGRDARKALISARDTVASFLGAQPEEITFTSGGTESNNLALLGTCLLREHGHIIISAIEHPSVLRTAEELEYRGFELTLLKPDESGILSPRALKSLLRPDTILVSIIHASNETGALQPVRKIGIILRRKKVLFHCDAVQSIGKIPFSINELGADLISLSAHKFGGPKGAGVLYVRRGIALKPILFGGEQERGLRAGTENLPGIVGLATALRIASDELPLRNSKLRKLTELLWEHLQRIPDSYLNTPLDGAVPGTLNLSFLGVPSESLVARLDLEGVTISAGPACGSGSLEPSYVLRAMGLDERRVKSAVRISPGYQNTEEEILVAVEKIKSSVEYIRKTQPSA